jgi:hypothetical protein
MEEADQFIRKAGVSVANSAAGDEGEPKRSAARR